ncbi:ATP-binding cassette domain-containing protein [Jeotgalibacillus soli]|uniref:ABC transporter n=1 Tax=Jeotgalibacillus soli TaxID=889306 RepID=A0A0C2VZW2_9BACL|nr:ATP-binding cassette domain-containing protein [Jeotgalibacillus soli]KIL49468.1 ABC transporter [Jeotgalibacillus soli]
MQGIDLTVYEGQIIGYIGPNGARKSTTVKIMLGLVDEYIGNIKIFGQKLSVGDHEYKKRIGFVPENAEIYDTLTVREYLLFIGGLYGIEESVTEHKGKKSYEEI